jgi:hypothetical protein
MHLFKSLKPLTIVPIIRTSRAITTCIIFHNHPIISIGISEIISYTLPFINNSPLFALNDMVLFLYYYYYYCDNAKEIINKYVSDNLINYIIETFLIFIYIYTKHLTFT